MAKRNRAWETMVRQDARSVYNRVVERLNKGEDLPSLTLPVSKAEFPKLLCLDMKVWVELAQVHYGKKHDPRKSAALAAIRKAVRSGSLVAPITATNLDEATKHPSEERRTRLAKFMVELSRNFSCLNHVVVRGHEIDRAIEKHLAGAETLTPIRPHLIHWGLDAAGLGRPARFLDPDKERALLMRHVSLEPESSVVKLVFALDSQYHAQMQVREQSLIPAVDSARASDGHLPVMERISGALYHFLSSPSSYLQRIIDNLMARRLPPQAYVDLLADQQRRMRFAEDLHQLYIWIRLWFERDRNPHDKPAVNDARDGSFLGQAIAYGNIVVTEKRWAHLANKTKIAQRYGTTVLGRVDGLPDLLKQEGCL
jgi:hypothetical protein